MFDASNINGTYDETIIEYVVDNLCSSQKLSFLNSKKKKSGGKIGNAWHEYWSINIILRNNLLINIKNTLRYILCSAQTPPLTVK